jgi:hypothetical protein
MYAPKSLRLANSRPGRPGQSLSVFFIRSITSACVYSHDVPAVRYILPQQISLIWVSTSPTQCKTSVRGSAQLLPLLLRHLRPNHYLPLDSSSSISVRIRKNAFGLEPPPGLFQRPSLNTKRPTNQHSTSFQSVCLTKQSKTGTRIHPSPATTRPLTYLVSGLYAYAITVSTRLPQNPYTHMFSQPSFSGF